MQRQLLLVDGMALLFRAFYATAVRKNFMVNSQGIPTNGVQGYLKHLLTAIDHINPTHIAVCWDMGSKTFRNDIFPNYKANREAPPIEMVPQFDLVKEVTEELQIKNIGVVGFEADDCIGTIASQMADKQTTVTVLTGDRDLLQIIDERINILLMKKGIGNYQHYTKVHFYEEYNIYPDQFIAVKALMGDQSDGYPGVRGIGEKTALKLIGEHGSIEQLLANVDQLTPSVRNKIENSIADLRMSQELAAIHCQVPLQLKIDDVAIKVNRTTTMNVIDKFELKSVRNHIYNMKWFDELNSLSLS